MVNGDVPLTVLERSAKIGFEYPVFMSWPHKMQDRGVQIVQALAAGLEDVFKDDGGAAVFFDQARLNPSYRWDQKLRKSLARSGVLVAFLLPTYFRSEYCCIEWNIGEQLEPVRLAGHPDHSIVIPIRLSTALPLPKEARAIQFEKEFQALLVYGKDVTTHENWRALVNKLKQQIYEVLELVCESNRNWEAETQIAMQAGPKAFDWSGAHAFPTVRVER